MQNKINTTTLLWIVLTLTVVMLIALAYCYPTLAEADDTIYVQIDVEFSPTFTQSNGHNYYAYLIVKLSGIPVDSDHVYSYKFATTESDWVDLPVNTNSFIIDFPVDGSSLLLTTVDPHGVRSQTTSQYSNALYVDSAPSITDFKLTKAIDGYKISFLVSTSTTGIKSFTVLDPNGNTLELKPDATSLDITEAGNYWFIITNMAGASSYYNFYADCLLPVFEIQPLSGASLYEEPPNWDTKSSFIFLTNSIPQSGKTYYYQTKSEDQTEYSEWIKINTDAIFDFVPPDKNVFIRFKAVSGIGLEYINPKIYFTWVDTTAPVLTIEGIPTTWVKDDVNLDVKVTLSGESAVTIYFYDVDSTIANIWQDLLITRPGIYRFFAVNKAGVQSSIVIADISYLDKIPPVIYGPSNYHTYYDDVKLSVSDFIKGNTIVTLNNKQIDVEFDTHNVTVFTKSGDYNVLVFDSAGNAREINFTIDKPNFELIFGLLALGVAIVLVIACLTIGYAKKQSALNRLKFMTSTSDDSYYNYLLFKRVRKKSLAKSAELKSKSKTLVDEKTPPMTKVNSTDISEKKDGID
jgi:hypothetical protein